MGFFLCLCPKGGEGHSYPGVVDLAQGEQLLRPVVVVIVMAVCECYI